MNLNNPLEMIDYYKLWQKPLSVQQFYSTGKGMYGGPRGTYGRFSVGPNVTRDEFKKDRERQSGE